MYSQNDEERYILEAVKDSSRKHLLDIGAWDPKDKSNSRALIEQGWRAVLIEPSPGPLKSLLAEYGYNPAVQIVAAAVAMEQLLADFEMSDDAISSDQAKHVALWRQHTKYLGRMKVWTMTPNQIFDIFGAFDFISIDAEGSSVDILKAVLKSEMYPACICVEHDDRIVEACQAAAERGYKMTYASGENLVFAR